MGVGETVNFDEKGRVLIPAEIRKIIGGRAFSVEVVDKDTIILRAVRDRRDLANKVKSLTLTGDPEKASADAASIKDFYGGRRVEDT